MNRLAGYAWPSVDALKRQRAVVCNRRRSALLVSEPGGWRVTQPGFLPFVPVTSSGRTFKRPWGQGEPVRAGIEAGREVGPRPPVCNGCMVWARGGYTSATFPASLVPRTWSVDKVG